MKIKMIGLDLDGTLLDSQKEISAYTLQVLQRAMQSGVEVVIATGRALCGVPKQVLNIGIRYAVTANGARISDIQQDKVIYETSMDKKIAMNALHILNDYDAARELLIGGESHMELEKLRDIAAYIKSEAMAKYVRETRQEAQDLSEILENTQKSIEKVHAIFRKEEERQEAWKRIEQLEDIELCGSLGNNIEVNAKGVNKGQGLLRLGEVLGIKREEIMAVGDDLNDVEMIKTVGLGIAMENGQEQVKKYAQYVTATNDEDGVAKAITKFVFNDSQF